MMPRSVPFAWQIIALIVGGILLVNVAIFATLLNERRGALSGLIVNDMANKLAPSILAFEAGLPLPAPTDDGVRVIQSPARPEPATTLRVENDVQEMFERRFAPIPLASGMRLAAQDEAWIPDSRRGVLTPVFTVTVARGDGQWLMAEGIAPPVPVFPLYLLGATLLYGIVICGGIIVIVRRITRPLQTLASAAAGLSGTRPAQPVPETGPRELQVAARAFNAMAIRLHELVGRQRATLWALGHDMRTPLTAMRLKIEMLDSDADREALLASFQSIDRVVDDALWLARAGTTAQPAQALDLCEMARRALAAVDAAKPASDRSRIALECPAGTVVVVGRPGEVERAVRNLIENAHHHGQGSVTVAIMSDGQRHGGVMVTDGGPGFPDSILERPGEPFLRGDLSRTTAGTGLGLAIVKAVAEGAGGSLQLANRAGGGACATIWLPLLER